MLIVNKTEKENGFVILYNICDKRGRSSRLNYRLSLCGHLIYHKDFKQVTKTPPNKPKCAVRKSCEFEPIREEPEKQGQLPGQDLNQNWMSEFIGSIMKLSWKHIESGVCGSVFTPMCALHKSLTNKLK